MKHQNVTPPPRFTDQPLTPPLTDKKPFAVAHRVIALFRQIYAKSDAERDARTEFQLADGEYDQIQSTLQQDDVLSGYVDEKIRYDYDEDKRKLVVRMPTEIHERFIDKVEDDIRSQLKTIQNGSGKKAEFAQKVHPARSTHIRLGTSTSSKSKYEPDASFRHKEAQYPGVIVEVAYSQKKSCLGRLAENYILDSDASIRAVVCVHIEYGNKESRKATLSVWRPKLLTTDDGLELRAVEGVADVAFRNKEGNPVDQPGLRLRLSEFAYEGLAQKEMGEEDTFIYIPGSKLCEYLNAADSKEEQALGKHVFAKEVKKRKRSETPPEEIRASDEARYAKEEERAAKRVDRDMDYQDKSSTKSVSD
ncbi:hypothetical protein K505DRAFT_255056 [Melanomma pulvis-pyrius CBS 109.77]|uniref:Uncharacterized protein n=1 Tax=Melanomma pulvis-pyrius CBS 109.77 TaxID=1314802 RepID=A0A6A6WXN8_9PLEO|nr:hypothetical protein K505DRAFT_255056 [Melanomma pulvis-pyrius CBS 109.77]